MTRWLSAIALCLFTSAGYAGGPVTTFDDSTNPCDVPFPNYATYAASVVGDDPAKLYALATTIRAGLCGDVETPLEHWQAMGLSDHDMAVWFNGDGTDHPQGPTQVPLPWAGLLMISALWFLKRIVK